MLRKVKFFVTILLIIAIFSVVGFSHKVLADNEVTVTRNNISDSSSGGQRAYDKVSVTWLDSDSIPLVLVFSDNTTLNLSPRQTVSKVFTSNQTYYVKDYPKSKSEVVVFSPLAKSLVTYNQVSLIWGEAQPPAGKTIKDYDIYRNSKKIGSTITNSFKDTGLEASTKYSYYIQVNYISQNNVFKSNILDVATNKNGPPTSPTDLRAAINTVDPKSQDTHIAANISWADSIDDDNVASYQVYSNNKLVDTVTGNRSTIHNLTPNQTYIFYVTAQDTFKQSSVKSQSISLIAKPGAIGVLVAPIPSNTNIDTNKPKVDKTDTQIVKPTKNNNIMSNKWLFLVLGAMLFILALVVVITIVILKRRKLKPNLDIPEVNQTDNKI